jgi:hypothetical protein
MLVGFAKVVKCSLIRGGSFISPFVLAGLFACSTGFAAIISLDSVLQNPSFEAGNQPINMGDSVGCPVDWVCNGSPTPGFWSYTVTSSQYTAGSDGLAGGLIVPNGTHAASSPTPVEGSGSLTQTGLGTYTAGDTYNLDLWVGTPLTVPFDGTTPAGSVGTIILYFLGNGGADLLSVSLTAPTPGQWLSEPVSFTPAAGQIGQSIGLEIYVNSQPVGGGSGNNRIADFDIAPAVTPEPGTFAFVGLGLLGLRFVRRKR